MRGKCRSIITPSLIAAIFNQRLRFHINPQLGRALKIQLLKNHEINKDKWDQCVLNAIDSRHYAMSWFLDIISPDWEGVVMEDYQSVCPFPGKKKYGIRYLANPIFCQQLGLYSHKQCSFEDILTIQKLIKNRYFLSTYTFNTSNANCLQNQENTVNRSTFELDLSEPYSSLEKAFSKSHKKNIRRAQKSEDQFFQSDHTDEFIHFLKLMYERRGVNGVKTNNYLQLKHIMEHTLRHNTGELITLKSENNHTLCAGFFIHHLNYRVLFTHTTQEGLLKKATFKLLNHYIEKNANQGLTLDFAGSNIESIAQFNKGWGARERYYNMLNSDNLSWILQKFRLK
jgi:hypothetical protein